LSRSGSAKEKLEKKKYEKTNFLVRFSFQQPGLLGGRVLRTAHALIYAFQTLANIQFPTGFDEPSSNPFWAVSKTISKRIFSLNLTFEIAYNPSTLSFFTYLGIPYTCERS
jgi:hypothetical protein